MSSKSADIHRVRSAAGRAGAVSRWGDGPRATECIRLYPADAAEVRRRATAKRCKPADIIAEALNG